MINCRDVTSSRRGSFGAVLPTIAVFIVLGLSVVGFVLYASSIGAIREQVRGNVRLIALAAVQGYFEHECNTNDVEACHADKNVAALGRARDVLSTSPQVLGGLELVLSSEQTDSGNEAVLTDGRWYYVRPSDENSDPCNGNYPCRVNRSQDELANCFTISGDVSNGWTNLFGGYFGSQHWAPPISFRVTASGVPLRFAFAVDVSASMAEDNFPRPLAEQFANGGNYDPSLDVYRVDASTLKDINVTNHDLVNFGDQQQQPAPGPAPGPKSRSLDSAPQARAAAESPKEEEVDDGTDEEDTDDEDFGESLLPYGAYFAFQTEDLYRDILDATAVPEQVQIVWQDLPDSRDDLPPGDLLRPNYWAKEDYLSVGALGVGVGAYDTYCADNGGSDCPHFAPTELGGVVFDPPPDEDNSTEYADKVIPYAVNTFRDAHHTAAQPWLSVMEALDEVVSMIEARQVPGDKVGMLFFYSQVYWKRTIKLTDKLQYINKVLDLETMSGARTFNQSDPPLWIKLGLFPSAAMYTDARLGLLGAFEMIADADDGVPAINSVVAFSDGLSTCRPDPYGCESSFEFYTDSMNAIRDFSENNFFAEKISLHVIQAGQQALPHFLGAQARATERDINDPGSGECYTDEMARLDGRQLVRGASPPFGSFWEGQEAWVNRFDGGFPQAAADWHALAALTGGLYVPIRPVVPDCTPADPATFCSSFPLRLADAERITTDPYCRTTREQVSDAIERIFGDATSKSFSVVETEAS